MSLRRHFIEWRRSTIYKNPSTSEEVEEWPSLFCIYCKGAPCSLNIAACV